MILLPLSSSLTWFLEKGSIIFSLMDLSAIHLSDIIDIFIDGLINDFGDYGWAWKQARKKVRHLRSSLVIIKENLTQLLGSVCQLFHN